MCLSTYLAAINVFHRRLPEEEVDEITLRHRIHKVGRCNKQRMSTGEGAGLNAEAIRALPLRLIESYCSVCSGSL